MQDNVILKTESLTRYFGAIKACDEVSLDITDRETHAVIGPNGAGKSTLMDLICNRTTSNSGRVLFQEKDITHVPPYKIANMGLCKCFQISKLFAQLSCFENIRIALIKKHNKIYDFLPKKDGYLRDEALHVLESVHMADKADEIASFLSYGDQRRLEIAITLALEPQLLILDEPTAGVARAEGYDIMQMIRNLAAERHMTVLFIEHDMDIVFNYADRISVMNNGAMLATDTPNEIRNNTFVQEAYLGGAQ
jgi:branched-chain amino acid transport system ATP-binding protein